MPVMIFPPAPVDGQEVTQSNGKTYIYNAAKVRWEVVPAALLSGGLVPLETISVSNAAKISAALDIVSFVGFMIDVIDFVAAIGSTNLHMRTGSDGTTPDVGAADYSWVYNLSQITAPNPGTLGDNASAFIRLTNAISSTGDDDLVSKIHIINPSTNNIYTQIQHVITYAANNYIHVEGSGRRTVNTPVNYFELFADSGNIATATMRIYGLRGA